MADFEATKQVYFPNGGSVVAELKSLLPLGKAKRSVVLAYGFLLAFVALTVFFAFFPSSNTDSPGFYNMFTSALRGRSNDGYDGNAYSADASGSQLPSIFSYFYPKNKTITPATASPLSGGNATWSPFVSGGSVAKTLPLSDKNNSSVVHSPPPMDKNLTGNVTVNQGGHLNAGVLSTSQCPNSSTAGCLNSSVAHLVPSNLFNTSMQGNQTSEHGSKGNVVTSGKPTPAASFVKGNQTSESESLKKVGASGNPPKSSASAKGNQTAENDQPKILGTKQSSSPKRNQTSQDGQSKKQESVASDKKQHNEVGADNRNAVEMERLMKELSTCDFYDGEWMKDDSYPLYKAGACSFIDEQFNCLLNGRPDKSFQNYKWKPRGCSLPRLNQSHMLEVLKGKRVALVGDSLNRNMWESLVCILKGAAKNKSNVYEVNGRHTFKGEASYSFIFKDYGFSVDFFASPFLVQEWEMPDKTGSKKETLRLDLIGKSSNDYKDADIIVFNTGHWWTHEKTSLGKDYYQEGSYIYPELHVLDAFRKALTTWAKWVDASINPNKSFVLFRGYSETHFGGGHWNSGGACDSEVEPIKNTTYLREYSSKMVVFEEVMRGMKTHVRYMNITRMTDYRKDGHPSIYRKHGLSAVEKHSPLHIQDCSHWCLPGIPDSWNEILYAELLVHDYRKKHSQPDNHKYS